MSPVPGATRPVSAQRATAAGSQVLLLLRWRPRALELMETCRPGKGEDPSVLGAATGGGCGGSPRSPSWPGDSDVCVLCVMGGFGHHLEVSAGTSEGLRGGGDSSPPVLCPRRGDQGRNLSPRAVPVPVPDPQFPSDPATSPSEGSLGFGSFTLIAAGSFTPSTNLPRPAGKQRGLNNQQKL